MPRSHSFLSPSPPPPVSFGGRRPAGGGERRCVPLAAASPANHFACYFISTSTRVYSTTYVYPNAGYAAATLCSYVPLRGARWGAGRGLEKCSDDHHPSRGGCADDGKSGECCYRLFYIPVNFTPSPAAPAAANPRHPVPRNAPPITRPAPLVNIVRRLNGEKTEEATARSPTMSDRFARDPDGSSALFYLTLP